MAVRRIVHAMGYRFRLHRKDLPGKPDLVFPGLRRAILVHGCFWHQHSECREGRLPGSRQDYWVPKLARNQERDKENLIKLHLLGWDALVIWECEMNDKRNLQQHIRAFLGDYTKREGLRHKT
jgi:DNA mismatch endonuclease (patch repair protein)